MVSPADGEARDPRPASGSSASERVPERGEERGKKPCWSF